MDDIGGILKKAREKIGKTQQQVADEVHVSRPYYADVERNRYMPSLQLLARLAILFNLDLNFLKDAIITGENTEVQNVD